MAVVWSLSSMGIRFFLHTAEAALGMCAFLRRNLLSIHMLCKNHRLPPSQVCLWDAASRVRCQSPVKVPNLHICTPFLSLAVSFV